MSKVIWMFSGQGSQYFDMGRDLYKANPVFRDRMQACDAHCERLLGFSILEIIYPRANVSKSAPFDNLHHTHPALLCIQYSLAQTLLSQGMKPDLMLGYSLGEWVALSVFGVLPFAAALESVVEQVDLLKRCTPPGGMLAVMASPDIVDSSPVYQDMAISAHNFRNHFVLSGLKQSIDCVQAHLRASEITHQRLPVTVAFHSPAMDAIEMYYKAQGHRKYPQSLTIPLVSLAYTEILDILPEDFLWNILRRPVFFEKTIRRLEADGDYHFVDLGPSGTLATFLKYLLTPDSHSKISPILTPFQQAQVNLERLESAL
ncbi:acyltransferase domain-containing protein [Leptothoe sp. EHU-05/26/07-4]